MKLKNKKTGKITEIEEVNLVVMDDKCDCYESFAEYHSLAELNADWEDYKPAEPLIKDEKIRKAVRAWAEANDVLEVFIDRIGDGTYIELYDEDDGRSRISALRPAGLKTGEAYTIAELCGEEENEA